MFLSTGGTNISVPINSGLMALDDSKVFLQAHLGNNMAATTFVAGNANVVSDTRRTGNWQFYVNFGNTITSAITASSSSREWSTDTTLVKLGNENDNVTVSPFTLVRFGDILTNRFFERVMSGSFQITIVTFGDPAPGTAKSAYAVTGGFPLTYFPTIVPVVSNYLLFYTFGSDKVSGTTVYDTVTNYAGTLVNGATIAVDANSRISGQGYLKLNSASSQYMSIPSFTPATGGISFSFWFYLNSNPEWGRIFDFSNGGSDNIFCATRNGYVKCGFHGTLGGNITPDIFVIPSNDVWCHLVWTIASDGRWIVYLNGTSVYNVVNYYPPAGTRSSHCYFGNSIYGEYYRGGIDNFRYYNYVLSPSNVTSIYNSGDNDPAPAIFKNDTTGVAWMPSPATPVNSSETNYTIKNNEIALTPGTNSTYAVWTATKSTNLKIDVSFADYHTRNVGVGFQMFKIKSDNTFDSVLFPRTVTSTALTNAAPTNYLPVPSVSTTVTAGDKIYLRVDANGNTTAASSVLATTIFTDAVSIANNPVETKVLQANLASNLNSAILVSGNSNTVLDTAGNSNWQFYVAGGNSIASVTGLSNSTEWTSGYPIPYVGASASPPPTDYSLYYTFNTNKVSGTTITDSVTNATGTLVGATITTTSPSPAPGTGYLSIVNTFSPSPVTTNHASLTSITFPTGGMTLSCWIKPRTANAAHIISLNTGASNNIILVNGLNNLTGIVVKGGAIGTYSIASPTSNLNIIGIWNHIVWTLSPSNIYQFYVNGVLTNTHSGATHYYPNNVTTTASYIGRSIYGDAYYDGDFDDFRIYNRILTSDEAYSVFMAGAQSKFNDVTTGVTWIPTPAVPVNSSETSYTVKSNEIALTPGANSTYAVWTAPKSTNIKVDVSFADYNSRNVGVGFQMFKINADNTFGSVIYPRTVTSTALTNAAPTNYLSVPSRTISVATGDKLYYRVDANGNTVAASSVLSTNIYVDPNQDLKQPNLLQAHLGNNMAATTFVSGNANVVNDTRGTGSWKFYVAGGNSIASITGASNSTEWTSGSLLTYSADDYSVFYPFNTNTVSGSTVLNKATNAYDLTLYGGASIINTVPSPASQPLATGSGYLSMNTGAGQYAQATQLFSLNPAGSTISFWFRYTSNVSNTPIFSYDDGTKYVNLYMWAEYWCILVAGGINGFGGRSVIFYKPDDLPLVTIGVDWINISILTATGQVYINGSLSTRQTPFVFSSFVQPTKFYFGNVSFPMDGRDFIAKPGTIDIDNFVIYNKTLTTTEIMALYAKPDLYYPMDVADINPGNPLQVGDLASGYYLYSGTLVGGATIAVDAGSRVAGKGYLKATSTAHKMSLPPVSTGANGLTFALWFKMPTTRQNVSLFDFNDGGDANNQICVQTAYINETTGEGPRFYTIVGNSGYGGVYVGSFSEWTHFVFVLTPPGNFTTYVNGSLHIAITGYNYPISKTRANHSVLDWKGSTQVNNAGVDDFRFYNRAITAAEITYLYSGPPQPTLKDDTTGVAWMPIPATPVISSETSYTIKNNEVALKPGTNSTFAVWTATKFTNLKIDVSFADYHTRSAGVGFQMFKIKSDNTFDSVLFPRTVTSTALTNAAPTNYLPVPTVSTSVSAGDKIYLRVDANGNTTAASSVLATTIFTDAVSVANNPVENRLLQAHLGNNLNATTFVSGNANVVLDTLGTSNWQFYVAPSTSVAAITSSSASSEWTGGSLLGAQYAFDGTLVNAATVVDAGSRVPGNPYLKFVNSTSSTASNAQYAKFTPVLIPSGGMSFSLWVKHAMISTQAVFFINIRKVGLNEIFIALSGPSNLVARAGISEITVGSYGPTITNGSWHHLVWTISASGLYKFYLDNSLISTIQSTHPGAGLRDFYNIGSYGDSGDRLYLINGAVDNFKFFSSELTASEVTAEYNNTASSMPFMLMTDSGAAPKWTIKPATVADPSETSYTVKSNEIAIAPGTNSTYAVWTSPKTTNIKVDVSFADYHSRNVGVGFQMFKINSDNTFGSVIYPRTVTSVALTNANPTNYLTVPSKTISVATGDKLYYRVDANGNTTAASSVLATTIYVDPNQDLKQYNVLQAHLGNNMAATTFVSGNSNVVADTRRTGNWKFYVAGGNSIASVTGSSNSTEWTAGSLLSYDSGNPIISSYSFDTTTQSGSTIQNTSTNAYDLTLYGATIGTANPSPYSSLNAGYLTMNISTGQYATSTTPVSFSRPFSISVWVRYTGTYPTDGGNTGPPLFEIGDANGNAIFMSAGNFINNIGVYNFYTNGVVNGGIYYRPDSGNAAVWNHFVITYNSADNRITTYQNGVSYNTATSINWTAPASFTYLNFGRSNIITNVATGSWTPCIDKFQIFNISLSASQVTSLYGNTFSTVGNPTLKNAITGVTWKPIPGSVVDDTETSYTIKNNEIALTPGTNSTFAVWTATKFTNLKIDVSFADYHTRSAGVGFQMFKIKSDNTFDSVLFPRTVTSTALTNAAPNNYLPVPSVSTTVTAGDKIYLRVDANGNTTAASSVLATTIFTDAVSIASNPVENRALQANLAANLNSTTFVSGNANVVLDTVGNSNWQFYVAPSTSVEAITSSSASSEWTGGSLLTYSAGEVYANPDLYYPLDVADINPGNPLQVGEFSTGSYVYSGTLVGGATIAVDAGSRVAGKGYLKATSTAHKMSLPPVSTGANGLTFALWFKMPTNRQNVSLFDFNDGGDANNQICVQTAYINETTGEGPRFYTIVGNSGYGGVYVGSFAEWTHFVFVLTPPGNFTTYVNGSLHIAITGYTYPISKTRVNHNVLDWKGSTQVNNAGVDDFRFYNRAITVAEITVLYSGPPPATLKNVASGVAWMPIPATPVDPSETSYTVKSNEIALTPGTNSTYAVWTAPKSTNIRVDVSFADYHSRTAGVGFQMFKINNDNTFGSTIFPRTVTSTALTNAAPTNYLNVPSVSLSVSTGDMVYYRVDANGNTTSASSVISTNIYSYSGKWN